MLYKEIVHNSQYLTMRDGIKLAATIYRPSVAGKAVQTPYPVKWEGTTSRGRRNPDGTVRLLSSNPRAAEQSRLSLIDIVKFGYILVQVEGFAQSFGNSTLQRLRPSMASELSGRCPGI
jgi:predicted acyl esterase